MSSVEIVDETRRYQPREPLKLALEALMTESGLAGNEFTLVLVDDDTIARRNVTDRGVAGPTDVLSYPNNEPIDRGYPRVPHLGDVFVSLDTAARQARDAGHPLEVEVATLAAHGLTHLAGHDHQEAADWAVFTAAQTRVVELLAKTGPGGAAE